MATNSPSSSSLSPSNSRKPRASSLTSAPSLKPALYLIPPFPTCPHRQHLSRSPIAIVFECILLNKPYVLEFLQEISKECNICAFVIDLFCTSALSVGKDLKIPTYYFFTSGAACLSAFLYFPKIHEQHTKSFKDLADTLLNFPNLPPLKAIHIPEPILYRDDPAYYDMLYFCSNLPKADGIMLIPLMISSQKQSRQLQMESGQRFMWVVKKPPYDEKRKQNDDMSDFDLQAMLPEGFLNRVKDRAMVVKSWAPQVAVLNHDSVGGFVTHCGWNSVLEAVVAGVPMVAWPLHAEQHLNRNVLVEI
ncbi:hypothetical protein GH714_016875 [Hevea brasiliensis]|uniref:anthocyanidin 3-O-glucosyltransferase n=1 Tax=Hevea brasiliensis TaxID=3981 RepID=A0A6A6KPL1_HEVBR|nr:hypothetical protein GH714_016875 [Hevea brasiliensis]